MLVVFISINVVSANDNATDISEVILDTSDADLLGENLVYNATLTSFNNTPLNNQTITFCINGVNYTRVTDINGSAFLNINLMDGIYPISTAFESQDNQQIINNNTIYVSHNVGTLIKENLTGSEIQKIIDGANSGDTLIFAGNEYNDVSLTVNKSLNIISIVKSVFKGNPASPVITVKSDNVNISNLAISSGSAGVLIDDADNVKISGNNIINNYNGISVLNSNDALISNNSISNSRDNAIYLKN
ncbi:MAG: right-handed parallel beta-helix repeat-containing protein, partial [Methanobrevibacter sp.]|nr:right-handed parallel beta-helix repeat-containing protein [Methanobrevibacter sp.]